ncbi:uncharacterized protein LOC129957091 [Argiope bruennichi]|uniref:uncharacterized protein LOC129957091 n=1 Tax=Argiope bruennichi TaxID=94029 RepID=UPI0024950290|nr:uncharacterized protein LOC129957091 [Argiope bruennichi]
MKKQLSFSVKLTLEEMALRRYFINLWCEMDVLSSIENLKYEYLTKGTLPSDFGTTLNEMVKEKISNLVLPESLKKRMMVLIIPVGLDIVRWKVFHENSVNWSCDGLGLDILKQLCWTPAGTVDYPKTAEKLLSLEALRVQTRYKLAALYCLVDYIPSLWEQLPKSCKTHYLSDSPFVPSRVKLDVAWAYLLTEQESTLDSIVANLSPGDSFLQLACKYSALGGNKGGAEYFFKRLTNAERNSFLVPLVNEIILDRNRELRRRAGDFPIEKLSEVVCFLLSQVSLEQQIQVLKKQPYEFFRCFLDWPLQDLCLEMAYLFQYFLSNHHYFLFIDSIAKDMDNSNHYFPNFLQELFQNSPSIFKNIFVAFERFHICFFYKFFNAEDMQTIKIIFKHLGVDRVFTLVSQRKFFVLLETIIMFKKQHMVKMCLEEVLQSEHQKSRVKEKYMKFLSEFRTDVCVRKRRWRQIFRDIATADRKRGIIEETATGAKKRQKTKITF